MNMIYIFILFDENFIIFTIGEMVNESESTVLRGGGQKRIRRRRGRRAGGDRLGPIPNTNNENDGNVPIQRRGESVPNPHIWRGRV